MHGSEPLEEDDLSVRTDTTACSPLAQEQEALIYPSQRVSKPQLERYEEWILKSDAYRWLLAKLKLRTQVYCPSPNIKDQIGSDIRRAVVQNMRDQNSLLTVHMQVYVTWDLVKYIESLEVSPSPDMWNRILCLTGSSNDVQSVTVGTYLRQTWPTTGERLEGMLLELLNCQPRQACSCMFPNNLHASRTYGLSDVLSPTLRVEISVLYTDEYFIVAYGNPYTIPEFAEQITWLAAALRVSLPQATPVMMSPRMTILSVETSTEQEAKRIMISSALTFDIQDSEQPPVSVKGTCWIKLFTNPIVVSGYPILRKSTPAAGLEASLGIMASLLQAQQVVRLENRIVMKGFDTLLVATEIVLDDNVIMWHAYTSNNPGKRISYFDPRIEETTSNERELPLLRSLRNCRHIIGWCSEAADFCGRLGTGNSANTTSRF